jgi:transposase-like protein
MGRREVQIELNRGGSLTGRDHPAAGRARHHRQPRNRAAVGAQVRPALANQIRRRLPRVGDKWHLDEVVLKIAGVKHWLWRAVDQTGVVLDLLVQRRRDKRAAKRRLRKLLKKQMRPPRVMITDKLAMGQRKGR